MCTEVRRKDSWFLDFKEGHNDGAGKRYLIQHSAGSGKSNSIAWLAHQLIGMKRKSHLSDSSAKEIFDSVIVVTDRSILDSQIQATIKQFMQVGATVGHAERSGNLRKFVEQGKKFIVSTVQKFGSPWRDSRAASAATRNPRRPNPWPCPRRTAP